MNLVVVDFDAHGAPSKILRRLLGSRASSWAGIAGRPWLVLAPPGDGGDRSWCRGSEVLEPARLLDRDALQGLTREVIAVSNSVEAALASDGGEGPPGPINRDAVRMWVFELLYREHAILAAGKRTGATSALILSSHGRRARWLAAGTAARGLPSLARGLPDWLWRRRPRVEHGVSWTVSDLPRADLLLVTESVPIAQSFAALGDALPASILGATLGISYVAASARVRPSAVRQVHPMRAPGGRAVSPLHSNATAPRESNPGAVPASLPGSVRGSFEALKARLVGLAAGDQGDFARHVNSVLEQVRPSVLVVGNDRCWSGQTYTRLARARGIESVVLQDGIAAENDPTWSYSTADHVLAAGSLWPRLLLREPVSWKSIAVVGQPRYDGAVQSFRSLRSGAIRPRNTPRHSVLLVLQDIHALEYLRTVLGQILRVEGTEVMIRAHPSYRPAGLERLESERVRLSPGGDVLDDLAWADLVVTEYSTVAVEALALGLPVLSVTLSGRPSLLDFTVAGQAECVTEASLIPLALTRLLSAAPATDHSPGRSALLEELVGPLDDASAVRVAAVVEGLLGNRRLGDRVAAP